MNLCLEENNSAQAQACLNATKNARARRMHGRARFTAASPYRIPPSPPTAPSTCASTPFSAFRSPAHALLSKPLGASLEVERRGLAHALAHDWRRLLRLEVGPHLVCARKRTRVYVGAR
eukprot:6208729-Pleurochrysis_carterae.AAC.2